MVLWRSGATALSFFILGTAIPKVSYPRFRYRQSRKRLCSYPEIVFICHSASKPIITALDKQPQAALQPVIHEQARAQGVVTVLARRNCPRARRSVRGLCVLWHANKSWPVLDCTHFIYSFELNPLFGIMHLPLTYALGRGFYFRITCIRPIHYY